MTSQKAGSLWLAAHFELINYRITHRSYIGTRDKIEFAHDNSVEQTYGPKYAPKTDTAVSHIEFMLKYDDLNLDFLAAVFQKLDELELLNYICESPSGRYSRRIGYLYEWLTNRKLNITYEVSGNYTDLLDTKRYLTGKIIKNARWRVNDNLLGVPAFCPIIRKTQALKVLLSKDIRNEIEVLKNNYSPEIFQRASQYLYRKETRSSYEIESEKPSPDRIDRFITLLYQAGKQPFSELMAEQSLTVLQNAIVDPRYAQPGFRTFQNYIGQTNYRGEEIYHYVCPPPAMIGSMMTGLTATEEKTMGISEVVRAAIVAFGFVFIHPFLDGNGRIHRFLIHDMLTRDGLAAQSLIIPVSAHMLQNMVAYDTVLEDYSKPLMQRVRYSKSASGDLRIDNTDAVSSYFRYPDLTMQSEYLAKTIFSTIQEDLLEELFFLERYDELKKDLQQLIDMPDKRLSDVIMYLHQNKGIFPNRRKKQFEEITDAEYDAMGSIYSEIFSR
ncbi:Fic family protein [Flavobacterium ardleyense]|uniref:Fic family protein n=1 Tax=Flavobacterium ardleyense TaxID=2038737 RepID=A0ABW5Z4G8_9FLAO